MGTEQDGITFRQAASPLERALDTVVSDTWTMKASYREAFNRMDLDGNGSVDRAEVNALSRNPNQTSLRPEFVQAVSQHFNSIAAATGDPETISEIDFDAAADIYEFKKEGELMGKEARDFLLNSWGMMTKDLFGVHQNIVSRTLHGMARSLDEHRYADYIDKMFPALAGDRDWQNIPVVSLFSSSTVLSREEASVSPEQANELAVQRMYGDGKLSPEATKQRLPELMDFVNKSRDLLKKPAT